MAFIAYSNVNNSLNGVASSLLQGFDDLFPEEIPMIFPPSRDRASN